MSHPWPLQPNTNTVVSFDHSMVKNLWRTRWLRETRSRYQ